MSGAQGRSSSRDSKKKRRLKVFEMKLSAAGVGCGGFWGVLSRWRSGPASGQTNIPSNGVFLSDEQDNDLNKMFV